MRCSSYILPFVDQIMIRKYNPPEGLNPHIDNAELFGPKICTLSLKSDINMLFVHRGRKVQYETRLCAGDTLVLEDEARFQWSHEIERKMADEWDGETYPRRQRYSVSFRTVPHKQPAL